MTNWIPSSIQKRLFRYALNKSGLLDVTDIDLDDLDISWGRRTALEFKNVKLNVGHLAALAKLPPDLRIESARILLLRLTVPADILNSGILFEVDGVDVVAKLVQEEDPQAETTKVEERTSRDTQSPSHRKTHRRIQTPPPRRFAETRLPTTEDLAKSFLAEEPLEERQELEASVAANVRPMDESIVSESSDGSDIGTGAAPGLPGFLSAWLHGLIDRFELRIRAVHVSLKIDASPEKSDDGPVIIIASLERADLLPGPDGAMKREVQLGNFSIELVVNEQTLSNLSSHTTPPASPTASRATRSSHHSDSILNQSLNDFSKRQAGDHISERTSASSDSLMFGSAIRSTDEPAVSSTSAEEQPSAGMMESSINELGIQMGDDNISWTSRRSGGEELNDDPWDQQIEDNLPESLLLGMNLPLPQSRTSAASSSPERSRRATSPYDRGISGPGSWPCLDESPRSSRNHTDAASWPAPEHSQHDLFQSMTSDAVDDAQDRTDNKRNAIEASYHDARMMSSPALTQGEDNAKSLEESRYFSHEEAESMYVSAISVAQETHMPGAWESESMYHAAPASPEATDPVTAPFSAEVDEHAAAPENPVFAHPARHHSNPPSESATPRGHTPSPQTPTPQDASGPEVPSHTTVQILHVDILTLLLPRTHGEAEQPSSAPTLPPAASTGNVTASLAMSRAGMPGAFSTYSQLSSSQRRGASSILAERDPVPPNSSGLLHKDKSTSDIEVKFGKVRLQADSSTIKLGHDINKRFTELAKKDEPKVAQKDKQQTSLVVAMSIQSFDIEFRRQIRIRVDQPIEDASSALLCLTTRNIRIDSSLAQHSLRLGMLELAVGEHVLLSFDRNAQALSESMIFEEDVRIVIDNSKSTNLNRPIASLGIEMRPVRIDVDLDVVDEVFSSFGGLSGILDIGNSMMIEVSPAASPVVSDRQQRVRFEGDAELNEVSPEYKVNASIAGLAFVLCADKTAVALQTASVKGVYREQAASVRFSSALRLSGPYLNDKTTAAVHIDALGSWIHYLFTPQEQDLERLLSLITPSKDKYDNDDDILLETLLRQRRKGACLRLTLDDVRVKIDDLKALDSLQALSTQVARLSAVTKYLPEDDKPGLLSLIRVKNVDFRMPVNERFGTLRTTFRELQCAHVGLPALLALSLSDIVVSQVNGPDLVHALVPLSGSDNLPMLMARMLDDEVEPVVKVKLYNVCVEYSIPVLLDLTGKDSSVDAEEVVAELATSIADLTMSPSDQSQVKRDSPQLDKKTQLHLLLHNSAIGLAPQKSPSKGLLILTDARCSTSVPPGDVMRVDLELHQAGLLITDDAHAPLTEMSTPRRNPPESTVVSARVLNALWRSGYSSVGSIMSAVINVRIIKLDGESSSVEVDVRNDFLLLETCADSMQTLSGILGGLSPSAPPSKKPKYLTEPITIDDMISSFSGDAYAKPERPMETLFDVDEEPNSPGGDPDDLLLDEDMGSSIYGPISGMIGDLEDDQQHADQAFGETVESLLDDDPFEMTTSPEDMPFSDAALMRDLRQQALPVKHNEPIDLGNYEIEDLGFDALGVDEQALGSRHRFSAPTSRRGPGAHAASTKKLPFKLRLRDVNATWHMHDGYDWQKTRDGITAAVEHVEQRAEERLARRRQSRPEPDEEESTIGDCMFNSVYITIPSNFNETPDIRRGINRQIDDLASESESVPASGMSRPTNYSASGRPKPRRRLKLERSRYHKISFELKGVSVDLDVFPPGDGELQSAVDVRLKQFEIFDNVPTSTWKKFLTQQYNGDTKELSKPMIHIQLLNRKTIQEREATDLMIHVAVQPLRLHVDQDALDFITRFTEFKDSSAEPPSPADQPFLSRVEVDTVDLQLDYKPKKVDYVGLRSGMATEFMNFVILDQANIRLRHAIVYGIRGFEPLHKTLNDVWMPDVKRNQLPTILAGLAPVRSLVNIGTGVRDVVAIPIREYKKDGRIVRSVQKGAFHFGRTTASELARLGAKVALGTQNLLSGAEGLLAPPSQRAGQSSDDPNDEDEDRGPRAFSAYADQPLNVLSGLKSARRYLEHDLLMARDALIAVQGEVLESSNPGSAAMAVARHAPTVMLKPVIGASRAVGTALLGVGNQIDRGGVRRMEDKYKRR